MFCVIFAILISVIYACDVCIWGGIPYSCGTEINCQRCCNGIWKNCQLGPHGGCICKICPYYNNENNIFNKTELEYKYTIDNDFYINDNGELYSTHLTLVSEVDNNKFSIIENVPSSKVQKGMKFLWPILEKTHIKKNDIHYLEHYNVTTINSKCCLSIKISGPMPHCEIKACCGTGCCC